MFLSEKQTRSIFAVAGVGTAQNQIAIKKTLNGKVFGQVTLDPTMDGGIVPTDKITLANIKKVAVSCPMTAQRTVIKLAIQETVAQNYPLLVLNITFPEWYGVGVDNSYIKTIPVNVKGLSGKTDIANKIKEAIEFAFKRETYNPFEVKKGTSDDLYLIERKQAFNPDNLIFHATLNMDATIDKNKTAKYVDASTAFKHAGEFTKEYSDKPWANATITHVNDYKSVQDGITLTDLDTNYYEMYELEHAGLKKGMDQHGLAGWPYVQPSKMSGVIDNVKVNYYVLDIHYVSDRDMYEHPRQEKTLTLIAKNVDTLETVLTNMGLGNIQGTTMKTKTGAVPDQKLAEAKTNLKDMGSAWVSNMVEAPAAPAAAKV